MSRIRFASVMVLLAWAIQANASPRGAVILIPGTFNSSAPGNVRFDPVRKILELNPYFSGEIMQSFESRGFAVHVVKDLACLGQVEANGEAALNEIQRWYSDQFPEGGVPVTLVGHSAGGFYALYVATHATGLPIQKIMTISTPFLGLELADEFFHSTGIVGRVFENVLESTGGLVDLRGLPDLTAGSVKAFLAGIKPDPSIQIYAFAGEQSPPPWIWDALNAENLSPPFVLSAALISGASDGVVSRRSAYGNGSSLRIQTRPDLEIHLEHPKQVLDYRIFALLGIQHVDYIRAEQARFYSSLAALAE